MRRSLLAIVLGACALATPARAQHLLVPMDDAQTDHLKAYGVTFGALTERLRSEWLLNYRGGSFLLPDVPGIRRAAALAGVSFDAVDGAALVAIRREIAEGNMDAVPLEQAPRIAVYTPPDAPPWDDAVTLALTYAGIPYARIWDDDVLGTDLAQFDWIHLHHEDFTGQQNKLHLGFRDAPWFVQARERDLATARRHGLPHVPALKKSVADRLRGFVERGGFLFAMCGATETLELAIAARDVDIAGPFSDGSPMDPDAEARMDWDRTFAVQGARLEFAGGVNAMSDIDGHQVNVPSRRQPLGTFTPVRLLGQVRPRGHHARAGASHGDQRLLRRDHVVHPPRAQAGGDGARARGGGAVGEVHPRLARAGIVDLPRRARSRGPAAQHRRAADGPGAAPQLARVSPDPEQRALPGRQEEAAQDVSARRRPGDPGHPARRRASPPAPRQALRSAIRLAGGREVCFVCTVDEAGRADRARGRARRRAERACAPGLRRTRRTAAAQPSERLARALRRGPRGRGALHDDGIGFAIIDNDAARLYVVVEVPREKKRAELEPGDVAGILGPDGPIAEHLGHFEDRPSQREMARLIARLFTHGGVGLIEAGTGVGKSLGYLVPALRWAAESGERTVVSTNTITLQEQLTGKDLPFLATALTDQKVRFALLKGWKNYLCLQRMEQARLQGATLFDDRPAPTSRCSSSGPSRPRTARWPTCRRRRGRGVGRGGRRGRPVHAAPLPALRPLLRVPGAARGGAGGRDRGESPPADGGHRGAARVAALGRGGGAAGVQAAGDRRGAPPRGRGGGAPGAVGVAARAGAAVRAARAARQGTAAGARPQARVGQRPAERREPRPRAGAARAVGGGGAREGGRALRPARRLGARAARPDGAAHRGVRRRPHLARGALGALEDLLKEIEMLGDGLRMVRERLESDERRSEELAPLLNEVRGVTRRLQTAGDALRAALLPEREGLPRVRWLEMRGSERNVGATAVPLDLAPVLREDLFRRVQTAIVTSATLAWGTASRSSRGGSASTTKSSSR
jgi:hypothetical protein